jgi:hypothetical protein
MATKKTKPTNSPELEAYKQAHANSVNGWLAKYTLLLIADGVKKVKVEYSGQGDSGQIDGIAFYDAKGNGVREPFGGGSMVKGFEDLCYAILDVRGWDVNNDGSQGEFTWDLVADTMEHRHETNVVQVETENFEGVEDLMDRIDPDNV